MSNSPFQYKSTSQENTFEDKYHLTWGSLPSDLFTYLFIYVASHLNPNRDVMPLERDIEFIECDTEYHPKRIKHALDDARRSLECSILLQERRILLQERDILSLSCVCKKINRKFLLELCHVTCYYPNPNSWTVSHPPLKITRKVLSPFYLHPRSISYTQDLWRIVGNKRLIIHCLMINLQSEVTYSKPQNLWDLSKLYSLVIKTPEGFDRSNPSLLNELLDQYQLPSLKELVFLEMDIARGTWEHLSSNLEFIQLVDCQLGLVDYQLGSPCNVNLRKFEHLKKFTILFNQTGDASCKCLNFTKCTMEFPGIFERLKFKDYLMLKVM
jgi:hypothetical protein